MVVFVIRVRRDLRNVRGGRFSIGLVVCLCGRCEHRIDRVWGKGVVEDG
jgi:hypothetical protein